ncbi:hypothetical protein EX30DRAFT_365976 [Ascodesmis nigricans]|uniref:Uncharacterized protein n=1 Tax=Ascodesmis nigricans TaxID=341454 RepID=A0A4S2MMY3_9PEZI|nr:hypothetical protein EX30DRAFT_365976 [Ascodesmis nigricans]
MLPRRLILRSLRPARPTLLTKTTTSFFTTSATLRTDSTDPDSDSRIPPKDELHPRRQEQTFSGSDEEIADDRAAYDPSVTDPREEKRMVGRDMGTPEDGVENPMEYSAATPEVSYSMEGELSPRGKEHGPSTGRKKKQGC